MFFLIKKVNFLVDSFDKFTSAYYLFELALLVQAVRPFSSYAAGTLQLRHGDDGCAEVYCDKFYRLLSKLRCQ